MEKLYRCKVGADFLKLFSAKQPGGLATALAELEPGDSLTKRLYPGTNKHGIASAEMLLQRAAQAEGQIWVYSMEHPVVGDQVRFSSRSELNMLGVLLDNTLEYIFFRDIEGNFILANKAFRDAVAVEGRSPDVGNKIEDFVTSKSSDWMGALDAKLRETKRPIINEVSLFIFLNGTKQWLQVTTVPVENGEGEMVGSLSVARDISDLKRTESELRTAILEANEASRAKGDFLAAMSHEIRTPINGIIGASELCRETPLDIEQRNYLDTVVECGSTLLGLINDILDFSKIEAGQLNLERLSFSPRNLLESVSKEFRQAARAKDLELVFGYSENLPGQVMGDPTRVKQVLYNLVSNALKFTADGEVALHAEVIELNQESVKIVFSVTDTGIGISMDRQTAIFQSFTQADMSTTRKYGGTGLGLSICSELVHLMGGEIGVKSKPGQGSKFAFDIEFPISGHPGEDAVPFDSESALVEPALEQEAMRVLVVEDNPINQKLACRRLEKLGHQVELVESGRAAFEAVQSSGYDCVLMDIQMPDMDGFEATQTIRSYEAEERLPPLYIIAMTAHAMQGDKERCIAAGMDDYIAKPFRVEFLRGALERANKAQKRRAGFSERHQTAPEDELSKRFESMSPEGQEDILAVAPLFLDSVEKNVADLERAMAAADFEQCSFLAHLLKGTAGVFSDGECTRLAEAVEAAAEAKELEALCDLGAACIAALRQLAASVEHLVEQC